MKLLFLGPEDSPLLEWLKSTNDTVMQTAEVIDADFIKQQGIEFIISYGYRHLIRREVLQACQFRAVNLHISLLPWNRGADPNFWSFVDDTPKGVSIHFMDEGVDTGDVIVQTEINMLADDTLRTSYDRLHQALMELFKNNWPLIRSGQCSRTPQSSWGTFHKIQDIHALKDRLTQGWDTPVKKLAFPTVS